MQYKLSFLMQKGNQLVTFPILGQATNHQSWAGVASLSGNALRSNAKNFLASELRKLFKH